MSRMRDINGAPDKAHLIPTKYCDSRSWPRLRADNHSNQRHEYGDADDRVCLALARLCDPDPVAPAFGGLRLLGHLSILFHLTLILVIILDFTYLGSSISCLTECRVADDPTTATGEPSDVFAISLPLFPQGLAHEVNQDTTKIYDALEESKFHSEQQLDEKTYKHYKVYQFLEARGILNLFTFRRTNNENLVREFYANLSLSVADPSSHHFFRVYIRGRVCHFFSFTIAKLLGFPTYNDSSDFYPLGFCDNLDINDATSTLTGDRVQEGQWGARLTASDRTALYFTLFIHGTYNMFPIRHDATVLPEDYLLLYAIGQGIAVNYGHMLFKAIYFRAHNRKYWKKLSFLCLIIAFLAAEEVFTVPLDVIVEAPVRTIRSIILKASSPHLADLPVSIALLEPVEYPAEALIFPLCPSLTPPTSPSATVGTSDHSSHVPILMTDDQYDELSYLYLDYLNQANQLHDIFESTGRPTPTCP
ncbi:hypothetical protein Syun_019282 [Stephania yunnanensis]|uniref:Putative plant transposon protein domain-containing protein n=1 Tax=Stephania yunnanensis TaxID=152371 RepID=A0AAP0IV01_9MAGN